MTGNKQHKRDNSAFFSGLLMVLLGTVLGAAACRELFAAAEDVSFGEYLLRIVWLIVLLLAAFYLQLILHEGGHLVCGLLTGYRFVSFRIGSWMIRTPLYAGRNRRAVPAGSAGMEKRHGAL